MSGLRTAIPRITLPATLTAVVGDTLQIFVRGIVEAENALLCPHEFVCAKGKSYPRYFEYTPVVGDVGTVPLVFSLFDSRGVTIASATATIRVVNHVHQPAANKQILIVGDSLTQFGTWPAELSRRLKGTGGSPAGLGYSNIALIGNSALGMSGTDLIVGRGGWTMSHYTTTPAATASVQPAFQANATAHGKTATSLGSWWLTDDGHRWVLARIINANALHFVSAAPSDGVAPYPAGNPPYSGTITYDNIDAVYLLMGWNGLASGSTAAQHAAEKATLLTFVNQLHADYPACKVRLMGLQPPSMNGGMSAINGAVDPRGSYLRTLVDANGYNLMLQSIAADPAYSSFLSYVDLMSQFDNEYNMPSTAKAVNARSATTESVGSNSVHPDTGGYYQIADAVYRDIVATFCQ
jgi:hypothetical protein